MNDISYLRYHLKGWELSLAEKIGYIANYNIVVQSKEWHLGFSFDFSKEHVFNGAKCFIKGVSALPYLGDLNFEYQICITCYYPTSNCPEWFTDDSISKLFPSYFEELKSGSTLTWKEYLESFSPKWISETQNG